MNELSNFLILLKGLGLTSDVLMGAGIGYTIFRLHAMDRQVKSIAANLNNCPICRKHMPVAPIILALLCGLLSGCQPVPVDWLATLADGVGSVALCGLLVTGLVILALMLRRPPK